MTTEEPTSEFIKWDFEGKSEQPGHQYKSPGIYRVGPPKDNIQEASN